MSTLDAILLVVLAVFLLRGFWRGFVRETMGLAAFVAAGIAAAVFAEAGGEALVARDWVRPSIARVTAGSGIFLGTYVGVNLLGWGIDRLARAMFLGPLLRIAGMVFAVVKGGIILGLALMAGERVMPWALTPELLAESRLAVPLIGVAAGVLELGGEWIGEMPAEEQVA